MPDEPDIIQIAPELMAARNRFLESIGERVLRFDILIGDFEANRNAPDCLFEIGALAHKISGVAATLGFLRMGRQARYVDQQIALGKELQTTTSEIYQRIETGLGDLLDHLDAVHQSFCK